MRLYVSSHRSAPLADSDFTFAQRASRIRTSAGRPLVAAFLALAAFVAATCLPAHAQVIYGAIVGTVTDASGAAVPGVTVKVASLATNEVRTVSTSVGGTYSVPNLPSGAYRLEVEQSGFKHFVRSSVEVQVDVTSRVDVSLLVGDVSESVEVTSEAPLLQTDSSSLGSVVPQEEVQSIPLSGRNINNLLTLVPGVVAQGGTYGNAVGNQLNGARTNAIGFGNYSIGGGFGNQSQFFVDGVATNAPANNLTTYTPSQDVVQEFRVVTNNVSAEYGNYAGGVINITSKSGSNVFHGAAYEYLRNKVLNANDFFSNRVGLRRPPLVQNQFGGTLGGPIQKDKTFFFFGFERQVIHTANLSLTTVPTAAMRAGDFSAPGLAPIYDQSQPGNPQFQCNGKLNVICPARLDPTALKLFAKEFPLPNSPGLVNNYVVSQATGGINMQYNVRGDHRFSDKNFMFARYGQWKAESNPFDAWGLGTQGQGPTGIYTKQAILGDTHTLSPSTAFDMRLSILRVYENEEPLTSGVDLSQFGSNYVAAAAQQPNPANWPIMSFNGLAGVSSVTGSSGIGGSQLYWHQNVYTINANLSKMVGRHQLKFGFTGKQVQWIDGPQNGGIGLTFDQYATAQSSSVGGSAVASALLGIPASTSGGVLAGSNAFFRSYGLFAEDTFQATKKLTLSLGLRWDQPGVYSEAHNNDTVFLPDAPSPLGSFLNPVTGQQQTLMGNVALVNSSQWPSRREDNLHWKEFSPRVGVAYRITDRTVVRTGYGISYPPGTLSQDGPHMSSVNGATTSVTNTFQVSTGSPSSILATVANPLPFALDQPPRNAATPGFFYGKGIIARRPGDGVAYVQQWNLAVEQQLGKDSRLSVAYAGSRGTNLLMAGAFTFASLGIDQLPYNQFSRGLGLLAQVPNPFYGKITTPGLALSQPVVSVGQLLRPFPQYGNVLALDPHVGRSNYHSLQTSYMKRFGNSGILTVAYTFSKLLSNTDSVTSFLDEYGGLGGFVQDNNNLNGEYSVAGFDVPHNLSVGYGLDLPFGRGKHFLHDAEGVGNAILSGWRINGITTIRTGTPIGFTQIRGGEPLASFGGGGLVSVFMRPDLVAGCNLSASGSREYKVDHGWFNTACLSQLGFGTMRFGNAPRWDGNVRTDNMNNWDFSVAKDTHIKERLVLKFTAEFYNTFNHPRFGAPSGTMGTPLLGLVTSQSNQPRAIQFGLRLDF